MSTPVDQLWQDVLGIATDVFYTPDAGNFVFTEFSGGGQLPVSGNTKIELFWDQVGDSSDLQLIAAVYTAGETHDINLNPNIFYTADGTARFVVRRTPFDGSNVQLYARVQGFTA